MRRSREGGGLMTQVCPVGAHPGPDALLVGALLWSAPADVASVLRLVRDDDVENPALAEVLAAVRSLNEAHKPHGPQLVLDELRRTARLMRHNGVAGQLQAATTSGADASAAWSYGAAVVAGSLRRRIDSAGIAFQTAASEAAESDLAEHVWVWSSAIAECAGRLRQLRGES
jgi:replicative DNA helicase